MSEEVEIPFFKKKLKISVWALYEYATYPTRFIEKSALNIQTLMLLSSVIAQALYYPKDMENILGVFFLQKIKFS